MSPRLLVTTAVVSLVVCVGFDHYKAKGAKPLGR